MEDPTALAMLNIQNVLVTTDCGPLVHRVYSHAVEVAQRFGARLHLLHVRAPSDDADGTPLNFGDQNLGHLRGDVEVKIVEVVVSSSSVSRAIVKYASEHEIDLILMGGRGTRGLGIGRLGGVAGPVVRYASCSVLTVRDKLPPQGLQRILVPIDLSDASREQLVTAREIARAYGAEVDLLMVHDRLHYPTSFGIAPLIGLEQQMLRRWEEVLTEFWRTSGGPEVPFRAHVRSGPPGPEIVNSALQRGSGLIVIATHGKTGLKRLVLGSVAEFVTRGALCATLTVKTFGRPLLVRETETEQMAAP